LARLARNLAFATENRFDRRIQAREPAARVHARAWERAADTFVDAILIDISYWKWADRADKMPEGLLEAARADLRLVYDALDHELAHRKFVSGPFSIADVALFPHLASTKAMEVEFSVQHHPNLALWFKHMRTLSVCAADLKRARDYVANLKDRNFEKRRIFWRGDRIEWLLARGFHAWFLEEIKRERVTWPGPGHMGRRMTSAVELARSHRIDRVLSWKEPRLRPADAPPIAQDIEQHRRKHSMPVLAALALLHAQYHAGAIDIGDLQRQHLGGSEPRPVGNAQRRFILGTRSRIEKAGNLFLGEHGGQSRGFIDVEQALQQVRPVERGSKEEPQRRHVRVHAGGAKRALHQVKAVPPQVFRRRRLWRPANERRKILDAADVVLLGVVPDMPGGHVLDHALTKRADTHTQLLL
jgi:Glutathione S-transferase, C-terminal domain